MAATSGSLYITYVEKHGSFLRIWGQMDKNLPVIIEKSLEQLTPQFDQGHFVPTVDSIQVGVLCCAKYKDGLYYRARIINVAMLHQNIVEVHFIDYGNRDVVPIMNLRTFANFAPGLITISAQARDFILANVTHQGVGWDSNTVALISSEIRYMDLQWVIIGQTGAHTLIKLYRNGEDVALSLFNRGLVLSIASTAQNMVLQNTSSAPASPPGYQVAAPVAPAIPAQVPVTPAVAAPPPTLLTYKAVSLEPGSENHVYVSYVCDGPCQFSVQLQKLEDSLARLMKELNRMNLQPLEDDPLPGTVCVARCLEDDHICRAVVTSMVDSRYKVFYVDFGNTEVVPIDNLYQIPFKYVIPKVMAMRYALAGLERSSVTLEMKCAFKDFVSDKLLRMRALPPPTRSALPLCSLWDSNNVNVLDVLRRAALLAYPEAIQLTRGFSQEVRVSYVHSCSHFYVQLKAKEEELRKVMAELQANCPNTDFVNPAQVKVGLPCCAQFEADGQWYRAQILSIEGENVKVRYVDYGNEELVAIATLRMPLGEQLTVLRPQAVECCLNGYQNMEEDLERDNLLEELILEKEFTMKVVEMQGSRALVDLIDSARYIVSSLLLERIATVHSQVSPLLIQDGHHIEQRKRRSPGNNQRSSQNYRLERKPREQNDERWNRQDSGEKNWERQDSNDRGWNKQDAGDKKGGFNRQDPREKSWSNNKQNSNNKGWDRQDSSEKGWNNKQDSWRQPKSFRKDDEEKSGFDHSDHGRGKRDGFRKSSWGDSPSKSEPYWKKNAKSPSQSEKSFSDGGSDKGWRRNSRSGTQNDDKRPKRNIDFSSRGGGAKNYNSAWSSSNNIAKVQNPAPSTAVFELPELVGRCEKVVISWFHNPGHFFCQLHESQAQFRSMMEEIQNTYCNIKPDNVPVGTCAVALFPDDGVMYRSRILEVKAMQYRVQYVDFGNVSTTDKVWPIENKFMQLPAQAVHCGLVGLLPADEGWPNPDVFSTYFDKDLFTCTFISSANQNYSVELTCDDQSISEALVAAGLASYEQMAEEIFDPSLLLGQQIQVTLEDVQSLSVFYVQLQNGLSLLCTMHNLESAEQTFEETLKQHIGSVLIMYVDNVLEEKIEVTLYDTTGTKLKIVEPDEGAYESIEMLCPLPVLYSTINGWVSYLAPVEGEKHRVFIQPANCADMLAQLLEELFNHYSDSSGETNWQPEVSSLCVVHSTDTNWYRGQVTKVEDQCVTVTFIDYGNSESVPVTEVRELAPQFKQQHILALEVTAAGADETFMEQEVTATMWYGENGWEAEIYKSYQTAVQETPELAPIADATYEATAEYPSVQTAQKIETANLEQSSKEQTDIQTATPTEYPDQPGVFVTLSHVDSPSEFYLQLSEAVEAIEVVQATLQEQADSFPDLENPVAGILCAAPYSLDQQWYRAQVLDADSDITTVRFVDFGNTDVLSNTATHIKTLPPDLLSLEQHARRCSLNVKATDVEWSPAACERFEQLTNFEGLTAEIVHQDEKTTYIELYAGGLNIAETLLQEGLAVKLQLETESSCTGYVSHLNSPSEFWVQLENSVADLEWIAEQLSAAENFPELEDLTPGSLCAALFQDDEMWYRARILSNTVAGLEVLFIDYGNSCTCTGLRQLPEDLIMLPALAQKCSLQKPAGILQWSSQASEDFRAISADGATIFNIAKLSTGETSVVKLLLDEEDIATKLIAKTEDAYISHFESVYNFWLQKVEDVPKLDVIAEKLVEASEWPKYEQKEGCDLVAALQPEDDAWYRARIVSEKDQTYEVLFVDYGNSATTTDVRMLMNDVEKVLPVANKYTLEPLPGFRWNEESSKKLAKISDNGNTLFQVEFVNDTTVRLYVNGNDIRADLDSICISSAHSTPKKSAVIKTDNVVPQGLENFISSEAELIVSDVNEEQSVSGENCEQSKTDTNQIDNQNAITKENVQLDECALSVELEVLEPENVRGDGKVTNEAVYEVSETPDYVLEQMSRAVIDENSALPVIQNTGELIAAETLQNIVNTAVQDDENMELINSSEQAQASDGTVHKRAVLDSESGSEVVDAGVEEDKNMKLNSGSGQTVFDSEDAHDNTIGIASREKNNLNVHLEIGDGCGKTPDNNTTGTSLIETFNLSSELGSNDGSEEVLDNRCVATVLTEKVTSGSESRSEDESDKVIDGVTLNTAKIEKIESGSESKSETKEESEITADQNEQLPDLELVEPVVKHLAPQTHEEHKLSSPIYLPQCRPSTPYSEKIVPGAVSRGDLTEVGGGETEELDLEETVPDLTSQETLAQPQTSGDGTIAPPTCMGDKYFGSTPSTVTFCKTNHDECIVPGYILRGESPEQLETEEVVAKTVAGAVNSVEDKVL